MPRIELVLPKMGESILEATVTRWLKKPGDVIKKDESVVEVATDKVDTEVPSTEDGILKEILIKEGEVAKIGQSIAIMEQGAISETKPMEGTTKSETPVSKIREYYTQERTPVMSVAKSRFYSPLVLNIAKEEGITMSELEAIEGTGKDERVTKNDILNYITYKKNISPTQEAKSIKILETNIAPDIKETVTTPELEATPKEVAVETKIDVGFAGEYQIKEMDRVRKLISQRMMDSQKNTATVTSFVEADVTNMVYWRGKIKHEFMKKEGEGITYTPMFVEAICKALKDFPLMNASIHEEKIILKKDINIGIAVALEDGNLIVPVIKNADRYNITGLTKAVNTLIKKARNGKLTPEDLKDGTYTISNVGNFGNIMGTPILVQPQVGIIALGAIKKKPAVIETEFGDSIGIRHMMYLSHSYDHRLIDGSLGGSFVKKVADYLEEFDINRKLYN